MLRPVPALITALWFILLGAALDIARADTRRHIEYLASEALEGRLTGTEGERLAADYLVNELKAIGALPLPGADDFAHPFEFTAGMDDAGSSIRIDGPEGSSTWEDDPAVIAGLSFSDTAAVEGPVVFAGYGLKLPESAEIAYDSFIGLDVKDKIVLILRYFPEETEDDLRRALARYSGLRYKAKHARDAGAKGLLVVTGPNSPHAGETVPMSFDTAVAGSGIVAASINKGIAGALLGAAGAKPLAQLQTDLDGGNPHVQGFELSGFSVGLDVKIDRQKKTGRSVVGYFPATDPNTTSPLNEETIILGAHFDHLGRGAGGDSLARESETDQIHLGADDNASGVAAVLEVAKHYAQAQRRRPLIAAFWSGEELGLLGSADFADDAPVPLDRVAAYINFDMVGRMEDNRLSLQGVGSSPGWKRLIERCNVPIGFDIALNSDPYNPTDSNTFYQAGVPVLHFFTGAHEDYHRPTDTADKINYADLERVIRFTELLVGRLMALDDRPAYAKVTPDTTQTMSRSGIRAFTGTIPDYTAEVEGLQLSGVIEGGPSATAGLQGEDIIVEFAGHQIANIYDYTFALETVKIGEPVKIVFLRDGERHETTITPTAR